MDAKTFYGYDAFEVLFSVMGIQQMPLLRTEVVFERAVEGYSLVVCFGLKLVVKEQLRT